jgi:valyl-tRNA synthetase
MKDLVSTIRNTRTKNQLKPKELLTLLVKDTAAAQAFLAEDGLKETIERIAYLETLDYTSKEAHAGANFIAGTEQYYLLFEIKVDIEAERKKLKKNLNACKVM